MLNAICCWYWNFRLNLLVGAIIRADEDAADARHAGRVGDCCSLVALKAEMMFEADQLRSKIRRHQPKPI